MNIPVDSKGRPIYAKWRIEKEREQFKIETDNKSVVTAAVKVVSRKKKYKKPNLRLMIALTQANKFIWNRREAEAFLDKSERKIKMLFDRLAKKRRDEKIAILRDDFYKRVAEIKDFNLESYKRRIRVFDGKHNYIKIDLKHDYRKYMKPRELYYWETEIQCFYLEVRTCGLCQRIGSSRIIRIYSGTYSTLGITYCCISCHNKIRGTVKAALEAKENERLVRKLERTIREVKKRSTNNPRGSEDAIED